MDNGCLWISGIAENFSLISTSYRPLLPVYHPEGVGGPKLDKIWGLERQATYPPFIHNTSTTGPLGAYPQGAKASSCLKYSFFAQSLTDFLAEFCLPGASGWADVDVCINAMLECELNLYNIHKLFTFLLTAYFPGFHISIFGLIYFVNKIVDFFFIQACG